MSLKGSENTTSQSTLPKATHCCPSLPATHAVTNLRKSVLLKLMQISVLWICMATWSRANTQNNTRVRIANTADNPAISSHTEKMHSNPRSVDRNDTDKLGTQSLTSGLEHAIRTAERFVHRVLAVLKRPKMSGIILSTEA